MRILTVLLKYPPQRRIGAELYDHELHKALQKAGHTVEVITAEGDSPDLDPWEYEGIQVNNPIAGTYDLILTHVDLRQKTWFIARINNLTHVPIVAIHHNNAETTLLAERLYLWDGIIYNSEHAKNLGTNTTDKKTVLIPPIKPVGKTAISAGNKIVQIGLGIVKGGDIFWNIVKNNPDEQFLAVEGGWGHQNIPHNKPKNVEVLPHQSDLTKVWKQAKLLLLPSKPLESWAMVASEAGRYGIQTMTFNDISGVIENIGDTGFTVPRSLHPRLPKQYGPNKETQQHFNNQSATHREQLKAAVKFLEGYQK